ncbi:cellulase family glycosylhydrolase [Nocardioides sp. SR21]|uniref:cellulase family glycosylhydrolase n=1 Tax=Nocardioides sp. SR21 TaxID=2919501 RepID=UPI001FA97DF5|nr:cellulase family glycosylhydrolase [Nocardioides sp. SR21]
MRYARWIALAAVIVLLSGGALYAQMRPPVSSGGVVETGAAHPVVQGNRIVDARSEREFVPRGVNWSSFEYACAQGWGMSSLDNVVAQDPAAAQAKSIAQWGANTVRLPLNQDCWLGTRGAPVSDQYVERTVEGYRTEVHDFITALNREGIVVILDLHSRKRIGQPEFGNLAMPDSESIAFWTSVATAYQDNPSVLFDAFNEPYSRWNASSTRYLFDLTWQCWRDGGCRAPIEDDQSATVARVTYVVQGMDAMVSAIRNTGATQPILLGGLDYSNDLSHWQEFAPDDDQLIAAFHSYDFKECGTKECWNDVIGQLADSVPVLTSELGAEDPLDGYVDDYLAWADEHNLGALFWVWADHPADPMALVADEKGRPTAYGRLARDWMAGHQSR